MKYLHNKISVIIFAVLIGSSAFAVMPLISAKNVFETIPTYAYLNVVPSPVAVGQTVYITMWIDKVPATAGGYWGDRWTGYKLNVTLPDGHVQDLGIFTADAAGGAVTTFVPADEGSYTFRFSFPGETLTGDTGNPSYPYPNSQVNNASIGNVYGPSSATPVTIEVGQTEATITPENPLPTEYWQRPVEAANHLWWAISGDWLGLSAINFGATGIYGYEGNVNPYTQPVSSAHVLWTKPIAFGGQLGGPFVGDSSSNYYTGMQYQPKWAPIIINGILYYTNYPGANSNPAGWTAVDMRTGKVLWTQNTTEVLQFGQVVTADTLDEYGGFAYLWASPAAYRTPVTSLDLFDAMTGNYVLTISGVVSGTKIRGEDGSILMYYTNSSMVDGVRETSLTMWNSSECLISAMPGFRTSQVVVAGLWIPPQGATIPFAAGIQWSTPLPATYQGNPISLGIGAIDQTEQAIVLTYTTGGIFGSGVGAVGSQPGWQIEAGYDISGEGPAMQLWAPVNRTLNPYTSVFVGPAGNGVYVEENEELMTWTGYSVKTGQYMWGPTEPYSRSLGYYQFRSSAMISGTNLYVWTFGGQFYDFNLTTGETIWVFNTPTTADNPYGANPFWAFGTGEATFAGGVIYAATGHNYGPPLFNGAKIYAINATDGTEIFEYLNFATMSSLPVVDGEMLSLNSYDNQIYAYGKGPSATTVTAPDTIQPLGKEILVQGTVMDQSPGTEEYAQTARFPNGVPAISDANMSAWMEYLYQQQPKPTDAMGVDVTVSVLDPNGNCYDVGTTTSTIDGFFKLSFTPAVPGEYYVYATFTGSESYYGSSAVTAINVEEPAATPAATPQPASLADIYILPMSIAIIIAIIVATIVIVLMLRKR